MTPAAAVATLAAVLAAAAIPCAAGDTYVYRVINAYNREVVGHQRQELDAATGTAGEVVAVTVDTPALGVSRTEMYAPRGHWLRRALDNHGVAVEYEFTTALPAVQPQLGPGQSWSARVPARVAGESRNRSVRVDGRVLAQERIRVAAGEFDTLKIQRIIYAGDADYFITETRIVEMDWYAPSIGRSVRTETQSGWRDTRSGCRRPENCERRGDWFIYELAQAPSQAAP